MVLSANGSTIEGTAVDSKDQPVADAKVGCIPSADRRERWDLYQEDTTDERGHFSLRGLNPGEYTVLALEDLEENYRDPEFVKSYENRGQSVRVTEGERKTVLVKVIPSADDQP